jgi:hypothetical protein
LIIAAIWPHVVAWPAAALGAWLAISWLVKAFTLGMGKRTKMPERELPEPRDEDGRGREGG